MESLSELVPEGFNAENFECAENEGLHLQAAWEDNAQDGLLMGLCIKDTNRDRFILNALSHGFAAFTLDLDTVKRLHGITGEILRQQGEG